MAATPKKGWLRYWWLLPLFIPPGLFSAAQPWLKTALGAPATGMIGAAVGIWAMGFALYVSIRGRNHIDEVEAAGAGFGSRVGTVGGTVVFVLLMILPPFWDLVFAVIEAVSGDQVVNRGIFKLGAMFGVAGTVVLQTIGMGIAYHLWWRVRR